jgi:phosphoglycerate dehydrogenase-like enzyme
VALHDIPTAEWTATAILAMQKCLPFFVDQRRQRKWALGSKRTNRPSIGLEDQESSGADEWGTDATVRIVGYGSIGHAIEARLAPFGAKFLRVGRNAHDGVAPASNLDRWLALADIVVLAIPWTSETRRLFDCQAPGQDEARGRSW